LQVRRSPPDAALSQTAQICDRNRRAKTSPQRPTKKSARTQSRPPSPRHCRRGRVLRGSCKFHRRMQQPWSALPARRKILLPNGGLGQTPFRRQWWHPRAILHAPSKITELCQSRDTSAKGILTVCRRVLASSEGEL